MSLRRMLPASGGAEPCAAKPVCEEASPPRDSERAAPPPWISHLEGRTLVEGIAEAFRHPLPGHPDPIGELLTLGVVELEQLCRGFMKFNYPEAKYSADARARVHEAFRRRAVDGMRDGHAQFRAEIAEFQATTPEEAMQMEGRLAAYPCSDESCRVFSAHYLGWILRKGEVLASRQVLQSTGVVDVDCPVCLGVLRAGEGVVTFHILECGHRIHEDCWFKVKKRRTASGAVRRCPLCRGASRSTRTFALKGDMA